MRPRNQTQIIFMIKALDNISSKQEPRTSRTQTPPVNLIRVRPEQIAHCAFMWDFLFAVQQADFVDCVNQWT
jgi:hypothetical protein